MTTSIRGPASQMGKPTTTPIRAPALQIMKKQDTIKIKQQLLTEEVFSPQITKFRRERIKPIL